VPYFLGLLAFAAAWAWQTPAPPAAPVAQEQTYFSQVMNANRRYRVFLPASYAGAQKRYPVLYWFHGYEQSSEVNAYSDDIAAYVAGHDLIVVDSGPLETTGTFPQYFPELVDRIDHSLRTVADRDHRGVSGYSAGGFLAFFVAGKYPDLVASASSFMGPTEYATGPKGFDTEYNAADAYANYDGVRTRLVTGSRDFIRFYHRQLNSIWSYTRATHETQDFDSEHGTPNVATTLDFHMKAFASPLPKPALFTHSDVYPNFSVWGWQVTTNRRQPGFTVLENVSASGFRSAVREWIPGGATIPGVKLSIESAPLYAAGSPHAVTFVRLRDGNVRHASMKADAGGRLNFDLDGEAYEVGVSAESLTTISGYDFADGNWLSSGSPQKLRLRFLNKGAVRSGPATVVWETPDPGVKVTPASSNLFSLMPGESVPLPITVTVPNGRSIVRIIGIKGTARMTVDVPVFPAASPLASFQIVDGRSVGAFQHATEKSDVAFGEGNGDGHAAPGESFAILVPDGGVARAAELFTSDTCVDTSMRASDSWTDYDHTGASAKYTVASIRKDCQPGHVVHMLARVVIPHAPDHEVRYWSIEFPVWYRLGEEPK
jgi:hypothetical protein